MFGKVQQSFFNREAAILHDLLMIPLAWFLSYWLRFNLGTIPPELQAFALKYLFVLVPLQAAVFWMFGLYRGIWRFASIPDLVRILKSTLVGLLLSMTAIFVFTRLQGVPRSVPVLYGLLLVILLSGPRLLYRWIKDHRITLSGGKRVLIIGAGRAGEMLVRDLLRNHSHDYLPVAFVDDKARGVGQEVQGVPIVGDCDAIPSVARDMGIDVIVMAVPSALVHQRKRLVELCEQSGVPFRTVPDLGKLMSGRVSINQLQEVSIEDLLGREPVTLDWEALRKGVSGRSILITGAGGSIGSELCRQIARLGPQKLILLDNSEFNLYSIGLELRGQHSDALIYDCIGDVRDEAAVNALFRRFRPDVVFHAAAYKHVPLLEHQIREALLNNVLGSRVVADAADRQGCAEFVLISTDKAVNPANIMGASKRLAEIYCQNLNACSNTRFVTVRFGNVLGSAGSVVPLFRRQIAAGGPVTVTHPDMERYFMTIPEACQLIMQAAAIGGGGEIFVLDMGEPVKIQYLAEQMIKLSGKQPGEEIEIVYTGPRPGEKLFEELFHQKEALEPTHCQKIMLARHRAVDWEVLTRKLTEMRVAVEACDDDRLRGLLSDMVPDYKMHKYVPELKVISGATGLGD